MLIGLELSKLVNRLNPVCRAALERAAAICVERGGDQVTHHHFVLGLLEGEGTDLDCILSQANVERDALASDIRRRFAHRATAGDGRPVFATGLISLLQDAWLISSVELGESAIRSGGVLLALLSNPMRWDDDAALARLSALSQTAIKARFSDLVDRSRESMGPTKDGRAPITSSDGEGALAKYTINFTEKARQGGIDPVFCRDREIRQIVDILGRRRKNNPICVGEAGVGKTAVIEGLALRVVHGDVPDFLAMVEILALDMGLLQAGASVKGEFENRLKAVIAEIKASVKPIVLFIDEAHTLIGAGGPQGGGDAANLLKPVLARGELRTIAATTWTEYKKYFEKDPALARRFQVVKIDEPPVADAALIIRGLRFAYEKAHEVYIRDDAVIAAAELSARYLAGRQLPDKAVDVLDTACARVRLGLTGKPRAVDDLERRIAALERERDAVERDRWIGIDTGAERMGTVTSTLAELTAELATMTDRWARERALVDQILAVRLALHARATEEMETAELETAERDLERAMGLETPLPLSTEATDGSPVGPDGTETALGDLLRELEDLTAGSPLLHYEVCPETIGAVISDWTGVPMGRMVRDESALLGRLDQALADRIRGQDGALSAIHRGILTAKARLGNPASPMGVFLLAGPSGVGKTETALALADLLFGGERFMITVNMSEFQEKHSVARLIGSPPGYVGYGEGGVLTEAVRQRPYSVVLLDEIEKADLEVMNLFYQVFDKGTLADGEGREIDFRNTVILMTTNLASREITDLVEGGERNPETIKAAITPLMAARLKPALLARMTLVPYFPLVDAVLADVARMKLNRLGDRLREHHGLAFTYTEEVVQAILARCDDVDTGARAVDHILTGDLSPQIAGEILKRMDRENRPTRLVVTLTEQGRFNLDFGDGDDQDPAPLSSSGLVLADE